MAPAPWTNQQIINRIDSGYHWASDTVTFGFPDWAPNWSLGAEGDGFTAFYAAQRDAARLAMQLWDDVAAIDLVEKASGSGADITLQNTTTDIDYAHAYFPDDNWSWAGSLWTNPDYSSLTQPKAGKYSFLTFLHEIGHTIGLAHPGNYNVNWPTYNKTALYQQDTHQYTVMSYFEADNTGADWRAGDGVWRYPQTPMLHDIMTLQSMYGIDTTTRTGDTVYGFNSTADRWVFDFTQNPHPILTIWDAAGSDTIDLSGFASPSRLSLMAGDYSDVDHMTQNIVIAYGAAIENAIGGGGNDALTGNALANVLSGNDGADRLDGGGGRDTLNGGAGADRLSGDQGRDLLLGGAGRDRLFGGAANDWLRAGNGNDRLTGGAGADRLTGGSGADTFDFNHLAQSATGPGGHDLIADFSPGKDIIDLAGIDADSLADGNQAFSFIDAAQFSASAGELRAFAQNGHTVIAGDVDGNATADLRIDLDGIFTLHAADFIL